MREKQFLQLSHIRAQLICCLAQSQSASLVLIDNSIHYHRFPAS